MSVSSPPMSRFHRLRRMPLVRRFTGYSLGSVVAAVTAEIAFIVAYAWGHAGVVGASAAGFVGGAVPNYFLNRRWAWPDRNGRSRRTEVVLYGVVALTSFAASVVVTRWAEHWARQLTTNASWQTVVVAAAYLITSGIVFVAKFVLYDLVVFTKAPSDLAPGDERSPVGPTRS
jgi:putative flippase GtrA